jgi:hypothetical protein
MHARAHGHTQRGGDREFLFDLKQDRGVAKRTDCVRNQAVEQLWKKIQRHKRMALLQGSFTLEEEKRDISLTRKHP